MFICIDHYFCYHDFIQNYCDMFFSLFPIMHLFFRCVCCMMRSFWDESRCLSLTVTQEAVRPQPYQNKTTAVYRHSLFERHVTSDWHSDPGHWLVGSSAAEVSVDQWDIRRPRAVWGCFWPAALLHMNTNTPSYVQTLWFSHITDCPSLLTGQSLLRRDSLKAGRVSEYSPIRNEQMSMKWCCFKKLKSAADKSDLYSVVRALFKWIPHDSVDGQITFLHSVSHWFVRQKKLNQLPAGVQFRAPSDGDGVQHQNIVICYCNL